MVIMSQPKDKFECMEYIWQEIKDLDEDTLIKFGTLVNQSHPNVIKAGTDGTRIFLNNLPEDFIRMLYQFVKNQIEILK